MLVMVSQCPAGWRCAPLRGVGFDASVEPVSSRSVFAAQGERRCKASISALTLVLLLLPSVYAELSQQNLPCSPPPPQGRRDKGALSTTYDSESTARTYTNVARCPGGRTRRSSRFPLSFSLSKPRQRASEGRRVASCLVCFPVLPTARSLPKSASPGSNRTV